MSFRSRLTLFFVVIVVVPMIAMAVVLFRVVGITQSRTTDARVDQARQSLVALSTEARTAAGATGRWIGRDARLGAAIADRDPAAAAARLARLRAGTGARSIRLRVRGLAPVTAGPGDSLVPAVTNIVDAAGRRRATLGTSILGPQRLADATRRLTGRDVVVTSAGGLVIASTLRQAAPALPDEGDVDIGDTEYRVESVGLRTVGGRMLRAYVLLDTGTVGGGAPYVVAAGLLALLALAFVFALAVSRGLQDQIRRLLDAARKVGRGDFAIAVPTEGSDEFAQLGHEFNAMAGQLEQRLAELDRERARLQDAIRRLGASFAQGLDRDAVLGIVVATAADGTTSGAGRASVCPDGGPPVVAARAGRDDGHGEALAAAERQALAGRRLAEVAGGATVAMAHPMLAEAGDRVLGVLAVAREHRAYSADEHDLLQYLAGQAALSIENVDLHEAVRKQAITDELTSLFNHRQFQEVMAAEMERARRFGQQLSLIMLDIDDFKRINDTHGHIQGDLVLREVARVLRETSREFDVPARYGGEELAVVLPQTDLEGAYQFAERVRAGIERLRVPVADDAGELTVTASLGVASVPGSAPPDKDALVAAADAALYRAKRDGKNRTARAEPVTA